MKTVALLVLTAVSIMAQAYSAATNFSVDLIGVPDTRPDTWGTASYAVKAITFKPPQGQRVRILRVYGDLLIWPLGIVPQGKFAGVLLGLQTTAPDGSVRMDWGADNTMLYIQDATGGEPRRAAFDYKVSVGGVLGPDNKLIVKMATWLNDTGLPIHIEPSFVMVYRFENNDNNTASKQNAEHNRPVVSEYATRGESGSSILLVPPQLKKRP